MKRTAIILSAILICTTAFADRPKVGLVLCGGGAKGAAHVGVLKVLEENNIPIDYIAGTSMGAIVGGLYAIGYTADELHDLMLEQDWNTVMSDRISRRDLTFEQKKHFDKYLVHIPFGIGDYSRLARKSKKEESMAPQSVLDNIPLALVNGQNVYNLFTKLSLGYQDSLDFNKMPIPFACVAVDMIEKKEVIFRSGRFVDAIRASMSIPGYFAPVRMDDMVLVDGGVLNNYPVDVVKEMGADIVIGVLLGGDEESQVRIDNISELINEMMSLYMDAKKSDNIGNTDILITPSITGYNALSFDTVSLDTLMTRGICAAKEKSGELENLKRMLEEEQYKEALSFVGPVQKEEEHYGKAVHLDTDTIFIQSVNIHGLDISDMNMILQKSILKPGMALTGKALNEEVDRLYKLGIFESVTYALHGTENPYVLDLNFTKGKNSTLGIGFRFDSEEIASVIMNVGIRDKALYGSKFNLFAKLAYNLQAQATYSYGFKGMTQFNFSYKYRGSNLNMFNQGYRSNFAFNENSLMMDVSTHRTSDWHSVIGLRLDSFRYHSKADELESNLAYSTDLNRKFFARAYASLSIDRMNDDYFPTRGYTFEIKGNCFKDIFSYDSYPMFFSANLRLSGVIPITDRVAVIPSIAIRSLIGDDLPYAYMNVLGGYETGRYVDQQIPFIGFNYTRILESNLSVATLDTRVRLLDNHYIFASGAYSRSSHKISEFFFGSPIIGARLGYSYNSVAGPLSLSLMWSNLTKSVGVYLSLGYSF
ncbi:MAG: patatin-like phospholipase family protein [Bacteroidales bacterium]|nr:patatin-like phospholipase family protein [Candidatus Cacconaster merdequi]